jgi:hypothetical protein
LPQEKQRTGIIISICVVDQKWEMIVEALVLVEALVVVINFGSVKFGFELSLFCRWMPDRLSYEA